MPKYNRPEITKTITLAIDHVSEETVKALEAEPEENTMGLDVYPKAGFGFFIYMAGTEDGTQPMNENGDPLFGFTDGMPDDLQIVMQYAASMGCNLLCLDSDAKRLPFLPWYGTED